MPTFAPTRTAFAVSLLVASLVAVAWLPSSHAQAPAGASDGTTSRTLFVDADAAGAETGGSWADAFTDLQATLSLARSAPDEVDSIWVAAGTYLPAPTNRSASFELRDGLVLVGGFAGTEQTADERDPVANPTILSGDIGVPGDSLDNSALIVRIEGTQDVPLAGVVVDGFTIADSFHERFGDTGLRVTYASAEIRACRFERNAPQGSGLNALFSNVLLEDVAFVDNAGSSGGGASFQFSEATLRRVAFSDNRAGNGGGLLLTGTPATLTDVAFTYNRASTVGGGLAIDRSLVQVVNARFIGNRGGTGGSRFDDVGGGLHIEGGLNTTGVDLTNALFVGNTASFGSALNTRFAAVRVANSTFTGNGALNTGGGAVRLTFDIDAQFDNTILSDNRRATLSGDGFVFTAAGRRDQIVFDSPNPGFADVSVRASIVEGGCPELITDANETVECLLLLDEDPTFLVAAGPGPDGVRGTGDDDGDFRLQDASPGIDFGDESLLPPDLFDLDGDGDLDEPLPLDLDRALRVLSRDVDLGPFESSATGFSRIARVDLAADEGGDGRLWGTAYRSLQVALTDAAASGGIVEEIWVAQGTYRPGNGLPETGGRDATFAIPSGVQVYGGFAGTEAVRIQRDPDANPVILSGEIQRDGTASNNAHRVVSFLDADANTVLDGFTIEDGYGGGGAGFYIAGGRPVLRNLLVQDNRAGVGGGGYMESSAATLVDVTFLRNIASIMTVGTGGGLVVVEGRPTLINTRFLGNSVNINAGGLRLERDTSLIVNAEFVRNSGGAVGGAIETSSSNATLINVVATTNRASNRGAGISVRSGAPRIYNSIFAGNIGSEEIEVTSDPDLDIAHSLVEGGYPGGTRILALPPRFQRAPSTGDDFGDLRLEEGSPGIDHGRAAVLPADSFDLDGDGDLEEAWPFDIAGLARVQGSHVDVGAYESPFSVATKDGVLPTTSVLEGAYPNPASTTATLELTVARAQRIRVEVLDLLGRTVSEVYEGNVAAGTTQALAIQAASLPAGLYFVRVRGEFFSATEPVTVAR